MALTPTIQDSQGRINAGVSSLNNLRLPQGVLLGAVRVPSLGLQASQARIGSVLETTNPIRVSQATMLAATLGRVKNFRLRAWTYSMDGHDFYVLSLGEYGTIVYDTTTGQWQQFSTEGRDISNWRAEVGLNWNAVSNGDSRFRSDVIAGDDQTGMLWYVNPYQPYDGSGYASDDGLQLKFTRVLTGGLPQNGRGYTQCNFVFLDGSLGNPLSGSSVTLRTSDNYGKTYDDRGTLTLTAGDYDQDLAWYSLGSFTNPGRMFQLTDDGALARIDALTMA